ncbi:DNA-binding response regulator OS=Streptomyces microflavus OX=1919 GN=Smic_74120 PE=4 SV=1 [Streptomyces microflavus]
MLRVLAVDDEPPALEELLYLLRADPRIRSAEGATWSDRGAAPHRQRRGRGPRRPVRDRRRLPRHPHGGPHRPRRRPAPRRIRLAPLIVFVTAHEGFAVHAFDLKAVDYVLKPVRRERLAEAVRRVAEQVGDRSPAPVNDTATDQIPVELGGVIRFIPIDEIAYAEAQGDYARLHTATGSHLVRIPLTTLEERWRSRGFVRIHRRHLVALGRIDELRLDAGSMSVRIGQAELAVSRRQHPGPARPADAPGRPLNPMPTGGR